ncbi:TPA: hypothetical protein L4657_006084 [Pseudomonas aeruginosa]|uniref:DUF7338 family protein n=1 Tax=Metapseudomonas otitidis TaxID=319939 RepID=UPI000C27D836|nr:MULTISPECIES: hypothetical protein [Pseudomonas]HBO5920142.1 hypothetical protein [Pseudomonas aeruginosa]
MSIAIPAPAAGWRAWLLPLHLVLFVLQLAVLLPLRVAFILAGFIVVPLALPFRTRHADTAERFSQAAGTWYLVTLPRWAWPWSNDRDGALGDRRGWWHTNAPFGLGAYHWFSMLVWLAFRNPANNLRFTRLFGCPVTRTACTWWGREEVEDDPGKGGVRFLMARAGLLWRFYGLYWVWQWSASRALVVQLGFKPEPSDWLEDYQADPTREWKGFTFEINPIKAIG